LQNTNEFSLDYEDSTCTSITEFPLRKAHVSHQNLLQGAEEPASVVFTLYLYVITNGR